MQPKTKAVYLEPQVPAAVRCSAASSGRGRGAGGDGAGTEDVVECGNGDLGVSDDRDGDLNDVNRVVSTLHCVIACSQKSLRAIREDVNGSPRTMHHVQSDETCRPIQRLHEAAERV